MCDRTTLNEKIKEAYEWYAQQNETMVEVEKKLVVDDDKEDHFPDSENLLSARWARI